MDALNKLKDEHDNVLKELVEKKQNDIDTRIQEALDEAKAQAMTDFKASEEFRGYDL